MDYISIGVVGKAHGIKGEVIVHPLTFEPSRFFDLERVFIKTHSQLELHIEQIREHKGSFIIKFKESIDRNYAESIRNKEVQIPESEKIELPEDVYFIHDLVDCKVLDEKNTELGKIDRVLESPNYDLYVVKRGKKEILIPSISKYVEHIDIETKTIRVREIEGLLDL